MGSQRSVSEQGRPSQRRYPRMSHFDHMSADPEKNGTNFVNEKSADAGVVVRGVDSPEGTVHRNLKARHLQMIAIGGCIGTGLFVGAGGALATGGPLGLWLGYTI